MTRSLGILFKTGDKVTVSYTMTANSIAVESSDAKKKEKKKQ